MTIPCHTRGRDRLPRELMSLFVPLFLSRDRSGMVVPSGKTTGSAGILAALGELRINVRCMVDSMDGWMVVTDEEKINSQGGR